MCLKIANQKTMKENKGSFDSQKNIDEI